jgi:recombination endonuclease VII
MGQEWCGKWMPRKRTICARTPGHGGPCKTAETMERNRLYSRDHPNRESPESRKKSNRKYRISSYGLTQELFDLLLEAQQNACGMCHEPFEERQLIHVDHDHACAGRRTDRAGSASADSCAIPATSH